MKRILSVASLCLAAVALAATLSFAADAPAAAPGTTVKTTTKATTTTTEKHMAAKPAVPATDINSASKEDLMKLAGIGDATAEKIIAGRPYTSKAQLLSKKIVTHAQYAKIRASVTAKQEK